MPDKRPEDTHRQRADMGVAPLAASWPVDSEGRPAALVSVASSDLIPTVQFGNIMLQCTITRAFSSADGYLDGLDEADLIERARRQMNISEFVVGSERRILQWATDPSTRVINPATGYVVTPNGDVPPEQAPAPAGAAPEPPKPQTPSPMTTQT